MRTLFFIIAILIFKPLLVVSQNHSLRLGLKSLYFANENIEETGDIQSMKSFRNFSPEPYIGYSIKLRNKMWLGIDIGYNKYTVKRTSRTETNSSINDRITQYNFEYSYLAFSIEEFFKFRDKYLFGVGLRLPIRYFNKRIDEQTSLTTFINQSNDPIENYSDVKWPKILRTGIFVQPSLSRIIFKELYVGFRLNLGILVEKRFGESETLSWTKSGGVETSRLNIKVAKNKFTEAQFSTYPSFYFSYFF